MKLPQINRERETFFKGPHRKDWQFTNTNATVCILLQWNDNGERCEHCYPHCGRHFAGCIFTTDFTEYAWRTDQELSQQDFDYWLIAPNCPQYHG